MKHFMDMTTFSYRGLEIEAEMEPFDPGVRYYADGSGEPPSGGGCEEFSIAVGDIDELCAELSEHFGESVIKILRGFYSVRGELPKCVVHWIEGHWDDAIREKAAEEYAEHGDDYDE